MASRWGSLLSQAVAGVESRLDTILAESDDNNDNNDNSTATTQLPSVRPLSPAKPAQSTNSRASSSTRANDRLQARLAKAMAGKSAPATADNRLASASPRDSSDIASRSSADQPRELPDQKDDQQEPSKSTPLPEIDSTIESPGLTEDKNVPSDAKDAGLIEASSDENTQIQYATDQVDTENKNPAQPSASQNDNENSDVQIRPEMEHVKAQHQEEIREYVERIDSLQSKLQYMSKNAADVAKKAASSAPAGSTERKIAEQDERIALLMEEGQKLAGAEQQYRTTIKKLRGQLAENEKQLTTLKQGKDKAMADAEALRSRLKGGEEEEKRQQETLKATLALRKEIDSLRRDKKSKDETIRRQEQEAQSKAEQAAAANAEILKKALGLEQEKQKDLEHKNASLKAECESLREKARLDETEWSEKVERAVERGRSVEAELRVELNTMENKLENMRVAAEEATSSSGGEAQVKLFRQIETLQSQYTSARANWQGIEASLMAKAAGLEKEKDEAQRRESEMRKRARDGASRCRVLEDELHDASQALGTAQHELETCRDQLSALRTSSKAIETALEETRAELEKEKRSATRELSAEAESRQWAEGVRPVSPLPAVPRTFSSDMIGLSVLARARRIPTPGSIPDSPADAFSGSRRPPPLTQPLRSGTMSTTDSTPHLPSLSAFESPMEAPRLMSPSSLLPGASPENGVTTTAPSSPRHLAQDMVSVSTVAAGPSVQLVERMSAAIRRLEAEKVTAKEEMARVCAQRDEARGDIASLMKEMEEVKLASSRVPQLEKEVEDLDARYQTTLELLGEKSELVDELRADVEDVKTMYRELVERAVK